jgi:hypothetical protein
MLMTQIVNSLTSKLEIGGPMASMYLLGNPDHYTSHKFRTFYWKSFINEARFAWQHENEENIDDQMVLLKIKGKIVGRTVVQDYIFCPSEFNHLSLYDWIRLSDIQKCNAKEIKSMLDDSVTDTKDELDDSSAVKDKHSTLADDNEENIYYRFQKGHPLYHSHHVALVSEKDGWVPNFVGGAIPRSDRGDKEYYCSVMLALFKPWRSGNDLKSEQQT